MDEAAGLKRALLEEGAVAVGVTPAAELPEVWGLIRRQEKEGRLAGMRWLGDTSRLRTHPSLDFRGARSIICSAWSYFTPRSSGYIARYGLCIDYHAYILDRIRNAWQKALFGRGEARFFVDSGPIAEKAYAARAGLGWIGKNSLLINPDYGSFFCLGLIVTDVNGKGSSLDKGQASQKHLIACPLSRLDPFGMCGDCSLCIDSCPTGALVEPGLLDCNRCISYLTTEHKGEIPIDIRPLMGTRIFGCDVCQEVCPYNRDVHVRNSIPTDDMELGPLGELMLLTDGDFKRKFEGSPIFRSGRGRFLRNVAVALGNMGDKGAAPFLARGLQDDNILIRDHSRWALEQINAKSPLPKPSPLGERKG